ncbi:MAG: phenylalanine--tRNA ligase subunit alpha [Desulfovibrio sp.]|mgnify:CR=1 FL=1|nr:MAG: phenylalanine--tRNA ligase subunit alpha [Desulfovibrio sp.]
MSASEPFPLISELKSLAAEFTRDLDQVTDLADLEERRVAFLGRKGRLAQIMSQLPSLDPAMRPEAGKVANEVKGELGALFDERQAQLMGAEAGKELADFDPSLPGREPWLGATHPVTLVTEEICAIFENLGYEIVTGPEVENDFHNFEALNMPPGHPARDMQDTLYVTDSILLRTHTSPLQIRTMLRREPPVAAIAPGKVYRRDSDLTHTPMFNQVEGLLVDTHVTMADLRGTLTHFVQLVFGPETRVRFRPSFFPFTEPSAEVDISCVMCGGTGFVDGAMCRVCKQTGWVEILGCGMVDPEVFRSVGYDSEKYTGFAFGLGVERVAMLKYGIGDLRMFFENDIRFIQQFT